MGDRMNTLKLAAWKAQTLSEYMRLSGDSRLDAEMFFDHVSDLLRDLHRDHVAPDAAVKKLMFDDEYDNAPTDPHHGGKIWNPR
jgi:hypothetical protein